MFLARFPPPQLIFSALIVVSVSSLGFVFYLEDFQGLPPCALCLYQRIPYYSVAGIAFLGVLITRDSKHDQLANILVLLCVLAFVAGSALALFHVGVENSWWQGTTSCGGSGLETTDFEDLKKAIMESPTANCREILWEFGGLSLATWNLLWSIFLALTAATFVGDRLYSNNGKT
mgnify:CR=1 FL=1